MKYCCIIFYIINLTLNLSLYINFILIEAIGGRKMEIVGRHLCDALTKEWEMTRRVLRRATLQGINGNKRDSVRRLNWGPEKLTVGYRSYRYIHIGRLLLMTLFGGNLLNFFAYERRDYGTGNSKKKWNLFRIGSYYRIKKLFTINYWCGLEFDGDVGRRTCCGRVAVRRRVGGRMKTQNGFVIEERSDRLRCRLENKSLVWLKNQSGRGMWNMCILNQKIILIVFMNMILFAYT